MSRSSTSGAAATLGRQIEELRLKLAEVEDAARALVNVPPEAHRDEALFRAAFDAIPEAVVLLDGVGRYTEMNRAAVALLGEGGRGRRVSELLAPGSDVKHAWRAFLKAGSSVIEGRLVRPDGKVRTLEIRAAANVLPGRHLALLRDVSEQRHLEEQLRHSDKMRAIGQLAGGLAHDFNNLLTAVLGYSDVVLRSLDPSDPARRPVQEIRRAGQRAAALARQLLLFGRKQILAPEILDLGSVVTDLTHLLQRLIGEDILLMTVLHPRAARVRADRGQLEQVIVNLAVNARDAMPHGGRLVLEVSSVELDPARAREMADARPGPYALLSISDTGVGMDAETRAHIFEPFFTTKEKGRGTGLGLSTVYGIVRQSGGQVEVASEPDRGTTFRVYLPRVEERAFEQEPTRAAALPRGDETILLAEDDPAVRGIAAEVLRGRGYSVLEAPDGPSALEIARSHPGDLHLLLTDMVMPGMTGGELADAFARMRPSARVLFMSGYAEDVVASRAAAPGAEQYLPKPLTPESLARKVREVLDR